MRILERLERVATVVVDEVAGAAAVYADIGGDAIRKKLDEWAFLWLINRRGLPRGQAEELLELLGAELGAKVELQAPP